MDQYIGKMLDNRYEILECIGNGGMAVVYKARDHRLNRLVAVKILKPELASDADFRRRFHDESQAVAMLSHANIVSVYDVSRSDGLDYIVMEMIDGLTLKQYMQRRGIPLNWREALHFITQIIRALSHAHSRGIIHRDIKPHNIMVLRDGSVKVTDFGIAQLTSAAQNTLTQEAIGSVHYISPEQARGSHVDCRTDIYSAGVVLYEMLTGRLPFESDTPVGVAIQHINAIPVPPRSLNPDVPEPLEEIIMKAMAPSLDQRYGSADEMLEDLKEFRKNPEMVVVQAEPVDEPTMVVVPAKVNVSENFDRRPPVQPEPEYRERRRPEIGEEEEDFEEPPRRSGAVVATVVAIVLIAAFIGVMVYFLKIVLFGGEVFGNTIEGMFGKQKEEVPNLLGYTEEDLEKYQSILRGFEWKTGGIVYSEEYEEGKICEQDPEAGSMVSGDHMLITVWISGGDDKMYMEDVENMDARDALHLLQNVKGLNVDVQYEYSDTYVEGRVIRYSLIEGQLVERGDPVTIWVSKGPETPKATVPYLINVRIEDVERQIAIAGLTLNVEYFPNDDYAAGRVFWQFPDAYREVDAGTVINVWVSEGPVETEPPASEPPVTEPPDTTESPGPEPSDTVEPVPSETDVVVPTTEQAIEVDLSAYVGTVNVRVVVGGEEMFKSAVDANMNASKIVYATASGTQLVEIYINEDLVDSYDLVFTP